MLATWCGFYWLQSIVLRSPCCSIQRPAIQSSKTRVLSASGIPKAELQSWRKQQQLLSRISSPIVISMKVRPIVAITLFGFGFELFPALLHALIYLREENLRLIAKCAQQRDVATSSCASAGIFWGRGQSLD